MKTCTSPPHTTDKGVLIVPRCFLIVAGNLWRVGGLLVIPGVFRLLDGLRFRVFMLSVCAFLLGMGNHE